jgi:hypothetical protein
LNRLRQDEIQTVLTTLTVQGLWLTLGKLGFFYVLKSSQRRHYTMEHSFNTNVAKEFDLDIATLLHNFKFWTLTNLANKKNIHDGLCWTYNSVPAFCLIFPYWTRHQIEHLIAKCKRLGLIVAGNYNKHKYDRTKWYALTAKAYRLYPELQEETFITTLWESISENSDMKLLHPTISENSEMLFENFRDAFLKNPRPIPDINTDEKPDTKHSTSIEVHDGQNIFVQKNTKTRKTSLGINELLADNPHKIEQETLEDWLEKRKAKRNKVTVTDWNKINKNLILIQSKLGINAIDAFETMVTANWQSLEVKYFENTNTIRSGSPSQGTGIKDTNGNDIVWE